MKKPTASQGPTAPTGDLFAEIRSRGGAAALKKPAEASEAPKPAGNDFLAEIRNKRGAAALKKSTA